MTQPNLTECCFLSIPKKGTRLVWEISQYCPFSCEYCFTWSSPKREKFEADINKIMPALQTLIKKLEVSEVLITGGEPLSVLDKANVLLHYLSDSDIPFSISTTVYDREAFNALLTEDLKINTINISVDPPVAEAARSKFKSNYELTGTKLEFLSCSKRRVKLTAVISRNNFTNLRPLLETLSSLINKYNNIEKIAFNRVYPIGYATEAESLNRDDLSPIYTEIFKWASTVDIPITLVNWSEFHTPLQECPAGQKIVSVQQNGDVTPCSLLYNLTRSFRAGNLIVDSIDTIQK